MNFTRRHEAYTLHSRGADQFPNVRASGGSISENILSQPSVSVAGESRTISFSPLTRTHRRLGRGRCSIQPGAFSRTAGSGLPVPPRARRLVCDLGSPEHLIQPIGCGRLKIRTLTMPTTIALSSDLGLDRGYENWITDDGRLPFLLRLGAALLIKMGPETIQRGDMARFRIEVSPQSRQKF